MMKYKLIVLDIDGTLCNSKKEITGNTKKALIKAQKMGLKVAIASGRPTCGINRLAKEIKLDEFGGFILSYNGAKIINFNTGEIVYEKNLPLECISEIYKLSKENDAEVLSYDKDEIITENSENIYVKKECSINKIGAYQVESFVEYMNYPVPKCLIVGDGDKMAELEKIASERFGDKLNIFRSEPFFLEIMPQNVDKAYSLQKLLKKLGLSSQEMIACGDGFNDISMIKLAGLGIAMANAQELVKQAADFMTLSNDDDGIAYVLDKFFFIEKNKIVGLA